MYTVGSLSDLISGNDTPNKQTVKIKEVKYEKPTAKKIKKQTNGKLNDKSGKKVKKEKKAKKEDTESPMETTEDILQDQNLNNAEKRKILKRKSNDSDTPKADKKAKLDESKEQPPFDKHDDRTVYVANLSLSTKEKDLKNFFANFGVVESVRFRGIAPANPKTSKKVAYITKQFNHKRRTMYAYVCFKTQEAAIKAKEADGKKFNNYHLRVEYCNEKCEYDIKKTVFIGNVPFDAEEEDIRNLMKDCGNVSRVRLIRDNRTNMGKGFGYVVFEDADAVNLALQLGTIELDKKVIRIQPCKNRTKKTDGKKERESNAIYIFDIPEQTTEKDLHELFAQCGKIRSTRIVYSDQTHCFVNFEDSEGVQNAVNMENPKLHGVPLDVKAKGQKVSAELKDPAIYIRNLPLKTTKEDVHEIFKDCGAISFIRLFLKKTRPTGVGFVNFQTEDALEKALEKKVKIGNSELMITRKSDKPKSDGRPSKVENLVEEESEEEEFMNDLTTKKKWDDDGSSSDDEESETNESPSALTSNSKMSEDVESGVENDDDEEEDYKGKKNISKEDDTESEASEDDMKKTPKKKQNAKTVGQKKSSKLTPRPVGRKSK